MLLWWWWLEVLEMGFGTYWLQHLIYFKNGATYSDVAFLLFLLLSISETRYCNEYVCGCLCLFVFHYTAGTHTRISLLAELRYIMYFRFFSGWFYVLQFAPCQHDGRAETSLLCIWPNTLATWHWLHCVIVNGGRCQLGVCNAPFFFSSVW